MTEEQRKQVIEMRNGGCSYGHIAKKMSLALSTVKSFCRRKSVNCLADSKEVLRCKQCNKVLVLTPKKKKPKFCSKKCRMRWWNEHPECVNRKAIYEFVCDNCGGEFVAYGNAKRKYCSHECYIQKRFLYN